MQLFRDFEKLTRNSRIPESCRTNGQLLTNSLRKKKAKLARRSLPRRKRAGYRRRKGGDECYTQIREMTLVRELIGTFDVCSQSCGMLIRPIMGPMSPTRAYSLDRMPAKQGLEFEEPLLIQYPRLRGVHWPKLSPQKEVLVLFFLLCGLVLSLTSSLFQSSPLLVSAFKFLAHSHALILFARSSWIKQTKFTPWAIMRCKREGMSPSILTSRKTIEIE